jgi:hypothetical protein
LPPALPEAFLILYFHNVRLLHLLASGAVQAKAGSLVAEFARVCPVPEKALRNVTSKVVEKALGDLYLEAGRFVQEQKLGVLRRAVFAKLIQNEMIGLGYPVDVVTKVVNALTVSALVGKPAQSH